jgi:RNA polymerase sigma factor (sigma-70 family)
VEEKTVPNDFEIVVQSKAKHGILWDLVQQFGSVKALAAELGVTDSTVGGWLNLRTMPRQCYRGHTAKQERAYLKLVELSGKPIEEIFPGFVRDKLADIPREKVTRVTVDYLALEHHQQRHEERMTLPSPELAANQGELRERLLAVVKTLSYREREIVKMRFGLGDGQSCTLKEVADIFKVGRERIRQIEAKAIRKLQQTSRTQELVGFLD